MRCGIYFRVSTDNQRDNGYSIDSQLRMVKEYCDGIYKRSIDIQNNIDNFDKKIIILNQKDSIRTQ